MLRINGALSGSSQDELVMMEKLEKDCEAKYITRDSSTITIGIRGTEEVYDIMQVFEFSSDRKMMSITVKR